MSDDCTVFVAGVICYRNLIEHANCFMGSDSELRAAAFNWLEKQVAFLGDVLPWNLLKTGFSHKGHQITFMNQPGIWRPRGFEYPLSIRTGIKSPYSDKNYDDGTLRYDYFGKDQPNHANNRGLREAWRDQIPLVYFKVISEGNYLVHFPVYITDNDTVNNYCTVDLSAAVFKDFTNVFDRTGENLADTIIQKKYALATYERRVHQAQFRDQVLHAYRCQCAMCRLKHSNLLDAAHIIPDKQERGDAVVPNGLALCKIHHAAFDHNIIGITPDYMIQVREDILKEIDGPMLKYGLQSMHGERIQIPRRSELRPDRDRLSERYELFRSAG
jgi:putative restriction endonuclease